MARIAGTAHIKIDGVSYSTDIEDGYTIKFQTLKATPITSSDGTIHYSETPVPDTLSGTLLTTADLNPSTLYNLRNTTIQVQLNNGKTAVLRNAFFSGDPSVSTKDGKFTIEFTGVGKWS